MEPIRTGGLRVDSNSQPAPPKRFPQWREVEQDFWLDMFESYSEIMLNQIPDEETVFKQDLLKAGGETEYFRSKVKLAAALADEATIEMIYRFERQKPISRQKRSTGDSGDGKSKKKRRRLW